MIYRLRERILLRTAPRPQPILWLTIVSTAIAGGCGLGYIEIEPAMTVHVVIENGTTNTAEIVLTTEVENAGDDEAVSTSDPLQTDIRVLAGQTATGTIDCQDLITLAATVADDTSTTTVQITGDGTGTLGFDTGTVGATGQRMLTRHTHFDCEQIVVLQILAADTARLTVAETEDDMPDPVTTQTQPDGGDDANTVATPSNAVHSAWRTQPPATWTS